MNFSLILKIMKIQTTSVTETIVIDYVENDYDENGIEIHKN